MILKASVLAVAALALSVQASVAGQLEKAQDVPAALADLPERHWALDAVTELSRRGTLSGYPDGTFQGRRALTRYEAAAGLHSFHVEVRRLITDRPVHVQEPSAPGPRGPRGTAGPVGPAGPRGPVPPEWDELRSGQQSLRRDIDALHGTMDNLRSDLRSLRGEVDDVRGDLQRRMDRPMNLWRGWRSNRPVTP